MNALEEVLKALKAAPDDIRLLQKAGELFQKRGDNRSAATYFARLAECYVRDGYLLRAAALLRLVKLDSGMLELLRDSRHSMTNSARSSRRTSTSFRRAMRS